MIRRWTPGQWALRAAVVAGLLVGLLATGLLGVWPQWWLVAAVGAMAVAFALLPESAVGTVATGVVLAWWGLSLRGEAQPQALVAAAGLLTSHVAALIAGYGPGDLPVDPDTVRRWAVRGVLVFLAAPAVLAVALLLRGQPEPAGIWVAGLAAALVATVAGGLALNRSDGEA